MIKHSVNLGIAANTPRGLVVPNIKDATSLDLVGLAGALKDLVDTARAARLSRPRCPAARSRSPTSASSASTPAPRSSIRASPGSSASGRSPAVPGWSGPVTTERIEPRWVTTLAVSFDHRLADGAQGSTFLSNVATLLGDPGLALLY